MLTSKCLTWSHASELSSTANWRSHTTWRRLLEAVSTIFDRSAEYVALWPPTLRGHRCTPWTTCASSRVDYCSSVLYGVCEVHLRPLQSVLKAAARLITGKRKFDHIASTMRDDLHWLPVRQRIQFKLSTLVSKCLRRTAPSYLTDMCIPVSTASGRSCL